MQLLQQVRIIDPVQQADRLADVLIVDGKIKLIDQRIQDYPDQALIIKPAGLILGTGLVDLYSHSGEPGNETRETLLQLAQGAAMGGFTQLGILPNTIPVIDNREVITGIKQKIDFQTRFKPNGLNHGSVSLGDDYNNDGYNSDADDRDRSICLPQLNFWGAAYSKTDNKMNALAELQPEIVGFTSRHNLSNLHVLKQILEYLQPEQKPIAIALDRNELAGEGVIREGMASIRYGMPGNPSFAEAAIIAAVLEIVAEIPTPIHIMRVSTQRGVELIAEAKARGINVTASTNWMHLLWSSEDLGDYNPNLRLEPPLANQSDRQALVEGVRQGIIDAISIDHQAYTYEEKTVAFALAPPGVIGLELALPLLWQRFVQSGLWSPIELWQALSSHPRQCIQQQPTAIAVDQPADLVLFDPEKKWIANQNNLQSPAMNTPWYNQEITGRVITTWRDHP